MGTRYGCIDTRGQVIGLFSDLILAANFRQMYGQYTRIWDYDTKAWVRLEQLS